MQQGRPKPGLSKPAVPWAVPCWCLLGGISLALQSPLVRAQGSRTGGGQPDATLRHGGEEEARGTKCLLAF